LRTRSKRVIGYPLTPPPDNNYNKWISIIIVITLLTIMTIIKVMQIAIKSTTLILTLLPAIAAIRKDKEITVMPVTITLTTVLAFIK
jgi:hypothetical protein